jgi:hypothetical protein
MQQNIDRNSSKIHIYLQIIFKLNINFVLFQKLFINTNLITTILYLTYYYIILESKREKIKSRVIIFVKKSSRFQFY